MGLGVTLDTKKSVQGSRVTWVARRVIANCNCVKKAPAMTLYHVTHVQLQLVRVKYILTVIDLDNLGSWKILGHGNAPSFPDNVRFSDFWSISKRWR